MRYPFRYFNSSPEIIRLAVMTHIRQSPSLPQAEDLLSERGIVPHTLNTNSSILACPRLVVQRLS